MKNLSINERCFKIRDTEYHLRLIPTKYFDSNEKTPSFFTQLGMDLLEIFHFTKKRGIVKYAKKKDGEMLGDWKRGGRFREAQHDSAESSFYSMVINLRKERPKKEILIEAIYGDSGTVALNKVLTEKVGRENKCSPLEVIE